MLIFGLKKKGGGGEIKFGGEAGARSTPFLYIDTHAII